jgi:uncharacterized membrane protein YgdD (TMEM256/DUF423 family)
MSQNFKTALNYWFWRSLGIFLLSVQAHRYLINTLQPSILEAIVLFVGLMFMIKPTTIPDTILKIFGKK